MGLCDSVRSAAKVGTRTGDVRGQGRGKKGLGSPSRYRPHKTPNDCTPSTNFRVYLKLELSNSSPSPDLVTNAANANRKYINMAEKKADAPAAGMLWGGRFTGWNPSTDELQVQPSDC